MHSLLPAKMCWDLMYRIIRGPQSMMMFKGQESTEMLQENNNITEKTEKFHLQ